MLVIYAFIPRNNRYIAVLRLMDRRRARRIVRQLRKLGRPAYFRKR